MKPATTILTYDDYLTLPNDGKRYEIIDGELYMTPAPSTEHQDISFIIERLLYDFVSRQNLGYVYHAPIDVVFSMTEIIQPDIIFIQRDRREIVTKRNVVAAPDLVVEILSETSEVVDRTTKRALYEKHGVKEYWIVDPASRSIEQLVLKEGKFVLVGKFRVSQTMESQLLKGLVISVEKIFP